MSFQKPIINLLSDFSKADSKRQNLTCTIVLTHEGEILMQNITNNQLEALEVSQPCVTKETNVSLRKKKRTTAEDREIFEKVKEAVGNRIPPQAIAIDLGLSIDTVNKAIAKLATSGSSIPPSEYQVIKSGVKIKDLEMFNSTPVEFYKVTSHESGGVLIKPYKKGDEYV